VESKTVTEKTIDRCTSPHNLSIASGIRPTGSICQGRAHRPPGFGVISDLGVSDFGCGAAACPQFNSGLPDSMSLEILHLPFMPLGGGTGPKGAKIPPALCLWVKLAGIESILA
jgi:hypothetical protein